MFVCSCKVRTGRWLSAGERAGASRRVFPFGAKVRNPQENRIPWTQIVQGKLNHSGQAAVFLLAITFCRKSRSVTFSPPPTNLSDKPLLLKSVSFFPLLRKCLCSGAPACVAGLQRQPDYFVIVIGKRKFYIGLIKIEVAHETGSLSIVRGEISLGVFFVGFCFYSSTNYLWLLWKCC